MLFRSVAMRKIVCSVTVPAAAAIVCVRLAVVVTVNVVLVGVDATAYVPFTSVYPVGPLVSAIVTASPVVRLCAALVVIVAVVVERVRLLTDTLQPISRLGAVIFTYCPACHAFTSV